ncbi:MAG: S41 family peptidase, partial [Bacteroidota bacterium]|nr:S41 family peptidase [Bacteroidota bacterium]
LWPMWAPDGKTLYYVSDRNGPQNLWLHPISGAARQLTQFKDGRVLWPSMAQDGNTVVYERDFRIWTCNTSTGEAHALTITRRGVPAGPSVEHQRLTTQFTNLALSPDGKKVAFVSYGDVFVASAKEGGDAVRITATPAAEMQPEWTPNSNRLIYVSERNGPAQLFQYNFITGKETQLTQTSSDDAAPVVSPDGKKVAFVRDGEELRMLDLATGKETLLAKGYFRRAPFSSGNALTWSPDSKWVAYAAHGLKSFRNVYVVPVSGGESRPVSFLANVFGSTVLWKKDGKSILFNTGQRTENGYVARVDLVPQPPRFRETQFRELFVDEVPTSPISRPVPQRTAPVPDTLSKNLPKQDTTTAVKVVGEGLRQRLSMLPLGVDVYDMVLSKDGNTLVVAATAAGQSNLYTYSLDELAKEPPVLKQLTSTPGSKSNLQITSDGKEVYYLEGGRIQAVALESRLVRPLTITAELDVDFSKTKMEVFTQAWEAQNKGFYDTAFHGVDWRAVRTQYAPYAAGAASSDELRRIISLMVGELNASHSGISSPTPPTFTTGYLGLRFDPATYEKEQRLKVSEVIALGPAALAGGIQAGDYIAAVDGTAVGEGVNIDQLLDNKVNRRVTLTVSSKAGGATWEVQVRPVTQTVEKQLLYKQWVQQQRDYVARISNGRLGYVHMFDMSSQSLDQLYLDMDIENHSREGVVVDVRNNNGGFVNAYALDVFARRGYMTMTMRGLPAAPARVQLGQRALDAPTILVTNQHSLSDAEDFTEGYRTLELGKVVGEPTAGWIIYTSAVQLLDGSVLRMPFIRITDNRGKNMELNPRPVDIPVIKALGEKGKDSQLEAAVKELLRQLDERKSSVTR